MGQVKIKYRPFPYCPIRFSGTATLSSDWRLITPEHFTALAELIVKGTIANPIQALSGIFHIPHKIITRLHPFHQYTLMDQVGEPLSGDPDPRNYIPTLTVRQPQKTILRKTKPTTLFGPADRLSNIVFGEFIYADSYFMAYGISGDISFLEKNMAVLFRPQKTTFTPDQIENVTSLIQQLPVETKIAWQYNYIILRHHLESRYQFVFPHVEEELEKPTASKPNSNDVYRQWMTVYDNFVGDDIINSERYFNKNAHEVLHYLNNKIRDSYKKPSS